MKVDGLVATETIIDDLARSKVWIITGLVYDDGDPEVTSAGVAGDHTHRLHTDPGWKPMRATMTEQQLVEMAAPDAMGRLFAVAEFLVENGQPA